MFNSTQYLDRIGYDGDLSVSLVELQKLQESHLLSIPFENLDIHRNVDITLDLERVFHKIIGQSRGGFCYELNGLFFHLLVELGYNVKRIAASVYEDKKGYGPELDHLTLLVKLKNKEYLVDVGFGDFTLSPLLLQLEKETENKDGLFKFEKEKDIWTVLKKKGDLFIPSYRFTEKERTWSEFEQMCLYHQTDDRSHFTQNRLITKPILNGRITLTDTELKVTKGTEKKVYEIPTRKIFKDELKHHFQMGFPSSI